MKQRNCHQVKILKIEYIVMTDKLHVNCVMPDDYGILVMTKQTSDANVVIPQEHSW